MKIEHKVNTISEQLDPDARIIWGTQISEDLDNILRVMLIVTGVQSSQIIGIQSQKNLDGSPKSFENELGIEFVN